jgi:ribosomal protein L11 methyltransferase
VDVACSGDSDTTLAFVDDFLPTAIEERPDAIRVFFTDTTLRDAACDALSAAKYTVQPVDVDDEDWARRSQENLKPVTIDRVTIAAPWHAGTCDPRPLTSNLQTPTSNLQPLVIIIQPSMGFGTGHHATTRLCLRALQAVNMTGESVLDAGTGSGVLAIAAARLGAAQALGIDYDADAIHAANENLALNPGVEGVAFRLADLSTGDLAPANIVTANLTGAALIRSAPRLLHLVRPGGTLIVSGLLVEERDDVLRALLETVFWEQHEDGWVALAMKRS